MIKKPSHQPSVTCRERVVNLTNPSYQPSEAELEEDLRVDASVKEIAQAVTRTAKA